MTAYNSTGLLTFTSGAALARHLRVKLSSGAVVVAGASDVELGTTRRTVASGQSVAVCARNAAGTDIFTASDAIVAGAVVEADADGKVVTFDSGTRIGVALTAAAADGDFVAVLRD